jgi:hypothetical protein
MTRLDRILLGLAYVFLIIILAVGVGQIQNTLEKAEQRRCDIEQLQLRSMVVILQNVSLAPDTDRQELLQQVQDLYEQVKVDCEE